MSSDNALQRCVRGCPEEHHRCAPEAVAPRAAGEAEKQRRREGQRHGGCGPCGGRREIFGSYSGCGIFGCLRDDAVKSWQCRVKSQEWPRSRGDVLKFLSHSRCCVDSSRRKAGCAIPVRRCGDFLTAGQAVCRFRFTTEGVLSRDEVFFGPETAENRRQAQSKPLESTSQQNRRAERQQGNSKVAMLFSKAVRDVQVTSTSLILKLEDLVCEKIAVKKEFGPSYSAPVPVLGIHGTKTVILPPLPGSKENRFASIDNVKLYHVADPAQQT
ncbi:hypothetical protein NDU88_005075 [Pleurodeles waltl]|uniref:Uncharacterized protein n=1 Tax=Pleurodeles waltl TaxID=8319 RepID=A0AAV7WAS8_PLEWA|nr:hypothetical protein NDU88_005075 [Pleurodeles waltl]